MKIIQQMLEKAAAKDEYLKSETAEFAKPPTLKPFTKDVIDAFKRLGDAQRGKPEDAMLRVQFTMGGGVLNPLVEHVGDLTHRMTMHVKYLKENTLPTANSFGYESVYDKVNKSLKWLRSGYGFEREFKENIVTNARVRKEDENDLKDRLDLALRIYAKEHEKLVVYNTAQWLARGAAIAIGYKSWDSAEAYLSSLKTMCSNEKTYVQWAGDFTLDHNGNLESKR